jgi:DNA-binding NarL/FixJ family response regulator
MELARQVGRQCSQVKIIVLTVHEDRAYFIRFAALN